MAFQSFKDILLGSSWKDIPAKKTKKKWTATEKAAVYRHLRNFIVTKRLPGKGEIDKCIAAEPALSNRSWTNVKDFCRIYMSKGSKERD